VNQQASQSSRQESQPGHQSRPKPKASSQRPRADAQKDVLGGLLRSLQNSKPYSTTHWEPSRVVPGAALFAGRRGGRFWHGFRRAAAAFMAARRSRRIGRFRSDPMHLALFPDRWGAEEMRDEDHIEIKRLLSPEDVARACGLSRRAVYRAIARGELRAARLCHRLRVHPAELERWIAEETCSPSPAAMQSRRAGSAQRGSLRAMLDEGERSS
jgi:excisionase family DNA binding protein